jgi:hypothetical protein
MAYAPVVRFLAEMSIGLLTAEKMNQQRYRCILRSKSDHSLLGLMREQPID